MKRFSSRSRLLKKSGFTLVELLVVIGIIAILAGVLFPAGNAAIKAAQRAKANTIATNIQTAVLAYNTEYSVYPVVAAATPADTFYSDTDATDWAPLIYVLSGNIHPSTGLATPAVTGPTNTRGIAFLNLKSSDVFTTGAGVDCPKNPQPTGASIYFNIAMDSDYDGVLGVSPSAVTTMPNFATSSTGSVNMSGGSSTAGVAVWANCNGTTTTTNWNPAFFVHTY